MTTSGFPVPATIAESGLPADLTWTNNGDGTATISGTPSAGDVGTHSIQLSASNLGGPATQTVTLDIASPPPSGGGSTPPPPPPPTPTPPTPTPTPTPSATPSGTATRAPAFTSDSKVSATVGDQFSFQVVTNGLPTATLSDSPLPSGLSWLINGDGTATISGIPKASAAGMTKVLLTASNVAGSALQVLAIAVQRPAGLTSGKPPAATTGKHYSFTVTSSGYPVPSITELGALPAGLTFTSKGNGKATISGVPAASSSGVGHISVTASNLLGKAVARYSLTVYQAPKITSGASAHAVHGTAFSFIVKTAGYPPASFSHTALPAGLKWAGAGNGTATISGTPTATAVGVHHITITARNSYGKASMVLKLTVS